MYDNLISRTLYISTRIYNMNSFLKEQVSRCYLHYPSSFQATGFHLLCSTGHFIGQVLYFCNATLLTFGLKVRNSRPGCYCFLTSLDWEHRKKYRCLSTLLLRRQCLTSFWRIFYNFAQISDFLR